LHQPGRGRVTEGMGGDPAGEPSQPYGALKPPFDRRYGFAVKLNEAGCDQPPRFPATHVNEQARRDRRRGLALLGGSRSGLLRQSTSQRNRAVKLGGLASLMGPHYARSGGN